MRTNYLSEAQATLDKMKEHLQEFSALVLSLSNGSSISADLAAEIATGADLMKCNQAWIIDNLIKEIREELKPS